MLSTIGYLLKAFITVAPFLAASSPENSYTSDVKYYSSYYDTCGIEVLQSLG